MRRKCRYCFGTLISFFMAFAVYAEEISAPKLVIAEPTYEFGSVAQGQKVVHDFIIRNSGSADLKIDNVVPSCGCTATTIDDALVKPGSEGRVHVEFDTTGFKGDKTKTVRVYSNDPETPTSLLTLNGSVEVDVSIEPDRVLFGDVIKGNSETKDVTVTASRANIAKIETNSPFLKLDIKEQGQRKQKFALTLSPETRAGELRSRVLITLDEIPPRVINVPVFASVKGKLQLKPELVSFGIIQGTEILERSVRLLNHGSTPVKIKEIKSSDAAVQCEIASIDKGDTYVIHVRVDPRKVENTLRAVLDIMTDSEEEEVLSLNVIGTVPAKL